MHKDQRNLTLIYQDPEVHLDHIVPLIVICPDPGQANKDYPYIYPQVTVYKFKKLDEFEQDNF